MAAIRVKNKGVGVGREEKEGWVKSGVKGADGGSGVGGEEGGSGRVAGGGRG